MDLEFAFKLTGMDPKTIVIALLVLERIVTGVRHYRSDRRLRRKDREGPR